MNLLLCPGAHGPSGAVGQRRMAYFWLVRNHVKKTYLKAMPSVSLETVGCAGDRGVQRLRRVLDI